MKRKELIALIEEGENQYCEFKLRFSDYEKIAKEIIAFANTRGGYILFGVDDNKDITGVESEKEQTELIKEAAQKCCDPPVGLEFEYFEFKGKEVVVVYVPESRSKPHRLQDYLEFDINKAAVYVRVNDKSLPASKEMIRIMRSMSGEAELKKYAIGPLEKTVFDYLDINEKIDVATLSNIANISARRASRTLVKLVRANLLFIHTKDNGDEFFTYAGPARE